MSSEIYAVVAYIARYWFAFLVVIIFWRAIKWLQKDADHKARSRMKLPDAGFIGEWVVLEPGGEMHENMTLKAPRDGWMGSARGCDVRLLSGDVPARVARFTLRRDGLHLLPKRHFSLAVDGEPVRHEAVLRHGATVTAGSVTIQLRLFAGILLEGETILSKRDARRNAAADHYYQNEQTEQAPPGTYLPMPALFAPKRNIRKQKVKKSRGIPRG